MKNNFGFMIRKGSDKYAIAIKLLPVIFLFTLSGCGFKLYKAIAKDNEDQVKELIEAGVNMNRNKICLDCYDEGETPLEHAARFGKPHMVKLLLDNGALTQGDELCFAAARGDLDIIKVLLDHGDEINNINGISYALLSALRAGKREAADLLTERGAGVPADAACITLKPGIAVYSVDGSKDLWKSRYSDSTSRHLYKENFLFLSPGLHTVVLTLPDGGTNYVTSEFMTEGGAVYLLDSEIIRTRKQEKNYAAWHPLFTKLK
jgi:hypothetical protein